jgi:acetolactate synthase-1/2/3 large subunit
VGDAKLACRRWRPRCEPARRARRVAGAVDGRALAARARADKRGLQRRWPASERPIRPEVVVQALNRLLPPGAIVVADPGTPCPYLSAYFDAAAGRAPLHHQPRARRAGLRDVGRLRRRRRPARVHRWWR